MKLTLANGQTLVDLQITEDGELVGQTGSVTYLPPSSATVPSNGMVRLELDSELIQGSNLEIGYEIKTSIGNFLTGCGLVAGCPKPGLVHLLGQRCRRQRNHPPEDTGRPARRHLRRRHLRRYRSGHHG